MTTVQRIKQDFLGMRNMSVPQRIGILAKRYDCRMLDIRECLRHQGVSTESKRITA